MRTLDLRNTRGWECGTAHRIRPVGGFVCLEFGVLACGDEAAEKVVEGLLVVEADTEGPAAFVFVDVDLGEERLVEQAPSGIVCLEVGGVAVAGEVEGFGQELLGAIEVGGGSVQVSLDAGELAGDAVLLGLEEIEGYGAGVVSVQELLALGGQGNALLVKELPLAPGEVDPVRRTSLMRLRPRWWSGARRLPG